MPGAEPLDHKGEDPEGARLRDEGEGFARLRFLFIQGNNLGDFGRQREKD